MNTQPGDFIYCPLCNGIMWVEQDPVSVALFRCECGHTIVIVEDGIADD